MGSGKYFNGNNLFTSDEVVTKVLTDVEKARLTELSELVPTLVSVSSDSQ